MEKSLTEIEELWKKDPKPILTNKIQNIELSQQFANSQIILELTGKEEDMWRVNLLLNKMNLTHSNYITYWGRKPIPHTEKYLFTIGPLFENSKGNVTWNIPPVLFKIKKIIHINELYTLYPKLTNKVEC
jgi:hypothetical protein